MDDSSSMNFYLRSSSELLMENELYSEEDYHFKSFRSFESQMIRESYYLIAEENISDTSIDI